MAKRLIKKKKKRGGLFRAVYRLILACSILIVLGFCLAKTLLRPPVQAPPVSVQVPESTETVEEPVESAEPTPTPLVRKEGFYTFLLVATDVGGGNTDTLMVASYDTVGQKVGVVSIPRDTLVRNDFPKINGIYAREGIEGLKEEVSQLTGVPIDYYVMVDIQGFIRLVDEVGGVDFYVPCDMDYDDTTPGQELRIHYTEGMHHLDGQGAMEVVRFRHNNDGSGYTDVGRAETQRSLLAAGGEKVLSFSNVPKFNTFVEIFQENVETDLSAEDIAWFISKAVGLDMDSGIQGETLPGDGTVSYRGYDWCYELEPEACLEIFNALLDPYTTPLTMDMVDIMQAS